MGEWKETTLKEVAAIDTGYAFKGDRYTDSGSLRVVRGMNVTIKDLRWGTDAKYWEHGTSGLEKYFLRESDIVIGMDGSRIGENRAVVKAQDLPSILAQRVARVRCIPGETDQSYLWQVIASENFVAFIKSIFTGTSIPHISQGQLGSYELRLPPLPEQRAIASVLSSLDAKIDLLHRQNRTLEGMAEALFREWFVEGKEEGWEEGTLGSLGPIEMGNSPKGDSYNEVGDGVPLINGPVEYGDYFPLRSKWTTDPKRFAEAGDLIFCVRGSTTGRRVVADGEYAIGRGVCAFRSKERMFLYQTIAAYLPDLLAQTTGSVFPSLSSNDIKNFPITLPPHKLRVQYEALAGPMLERIEANHRQCATLAALRDTLLPKLMSGEVKVGN